jgi:hypothetical protein
MRSFQFPWLTLCLLTILTSPARATIQPGEPVGSFDITRFDVGGDTLLGTQHSTFIAEYLQGRASGVASRQIELREQRVAALAAHQVSGRFRYVSLSLAQANAAGGPNNGGMNPGLYVQVLDGMINVKNGGGSQNFMAGQFGFTPGFTQPPVILPNNPGLQFTPPPSFSTPGGAQNSNGGGKPGNVDCIVR